MSKKDSFKFPKKARHLTLSSQTIFRVVQAVIDYNYGKSGNVSQHIFIDVANTQWIAESILDKYVYKAFCHPLLLQQTLINLHEEIFICHQRLNITTRSYTRVSARVKSQIIASIQQLYMQSLQAEQTTSK